MWYDNLDAKLDREIDQNKDLGEMRKGSYYYIRADGHPDGIRAVLKAKESAGISSGSHYCHVYLANFGPFISDNTRVTWYDFKIMRINRDLAVRYTNLVNSDVGSSLYF